MRNVLQQKQRGKCTVILKEHRKERPSSTKKHWGKMFLIEQISVTRSWNGDEKRRK